jgi:hypothetical protein
MMTLNGNQAHAIAALVHEVRPEWEVAGIAKALYAAKDRDPFDVAHAALYAAADHANRTPAVIPLAGAHWTRGRELASTDAIPGRIDPRCEVHDWERARGCRACRSEALEATEQTRTLVAQHIPTERVRQILADAPTTDIRRLAAGDRDE